MSQIMEGVHRCPWTYAIPEANILKVKYRLFVSRFTKSTASSAAVFRYSKVGKALAGSLVM